MKVYIVKFLSISIQFLFFSIAIFVNFSNDIYANPESRDSLKLTDNLENYIVENGYYRAVIPKSSSSEAKGLVKHLYIKNSEGNWSKDLIYQKNLVYGLGYLEGANDSSHNENSSYGMQGNHKIDIKVLEVSSAEITIQSTLDTKTAQFKETWSFWARKPYFQSRASIVNTKNILTNQLQFAWMVNSDIPISWYGTNAFGKVENYNTRVFQSINSPYLDAYPWINWQFPSEDVSLGLIFTDIYNKNVVLGETGDQPFEYQLNFELGSGSLSNPISNGYKREVNTIYFTNSKASSDLIQNFSSSAYVNSLKVPTENPILQASAYAINSYGQNNGISSALLNSPYFLVRQNSQNVSNDPQKEPEYLTSIYAPLYKEQKAKKKGQYNYQDQLQYTLNYSNDKETYVYGEITSAEAKNTDSEKVLINRAISNDEKLIYSTNFTTWNDSDKLQITGIVSNNSQSTLVKNIFVSLLSIPQDSLSSTSLISLGSNIYDLRFEGPIYKQLGLGIKVNYPSNNLVLNNNQLQVYLYKQESEKLLTNFKYSFSIEVYPHKGWLKDPSKFTSLHSQDKIIYPKHEFYIPFGLHIGFINTVYSDGSITYSPHPYNSSSKIDLSIIPSKENVNVNIDTWNRNGLRYKKWEETSLEKDISSSHIVGDLYSNYYYSVFINKQLFGNYLSNNLAEISFTSMNTKTETVFEIQPSLCLHNTKEKLLNLVNRK